MPWKTPCLCAQRWRLVKSWRAGKMALSGLCRRIGISRKTAYKWIARFEQEGRRGLNDRGRRAHSVHNRPSRRWLERVRHVRLRHPAWGARKLRALLCRRYGAYGVPAAAAISRWLRRWRLTQPSHRRGHRRGPLIDRPHLTVAGRPNEVWSVDFKGWFRTGDGRRVDPLTIRDMASCYLVAVELLPNESVNRTRAAFERTFRRQGLPEAIRVDNGCPFGADGALGLTRLSVWWIRLGIRVEFITPGCPGENGAHEQMHRIYKAETAKPPAPSLRAQKRRTARWRREYNELRPHEALAMRCPAEVYRRSTRRMPVGLLPLHYPRDWLSRLVKGKGMICLHGRGRFVGEAFDGQRVGLKRITAGWEVYLGTHLIGTLGAEETTGIHAVRHKTNRPPTKRTTQPEQGSQRWRTGMCR